MRWSRPKFLFYVAAKKCALLGCDSPTRQCGAATIAPRDSEPPLMNDAASAHAAATATATLIDARVRAHTQQFGLQTGGGVKFDDARRSSVKKENAVKFAIVEPPFARLLSYDLSRNSNCGKIHGSAPRSEYSRSERLAIFCARARSLASDASATPTATCRILTCRTAVRARVFVARSSGRSSA